MQLFLPLLFVLCAAESVRGVFDGTCPSKEPPHGVLVLSPGSKLVLTCSGHVKVNGVKVTTSKNGSNRVRRVNSSNATPTHVNITNSTEDSIKSSKVTMDIAVSERHQSDLSETEKVIAHTDSGYTASPTTHSVQRSSMSWILKSGSDLEAEEVEDFEEDDGEEGSRVTRGIKLIYQWKWNGRTLGKGDRDWGEITLEGRGETLSLSIVRVIDSGKYTCFSKGREMFSLRVTIADPPETPYLSCYKRSPSSKIRCEWTPQKAVTITPECYLFLSKKVGLQSEPFQRLKCSYSLRLSRCWCALDFNEDHLRTLHTVYLCVTSIAGNATSSLLHFRPLSILQPEPPSKVLVQQEAGQETRLKVTWNAPGSWKSQDSYYELIYEIRYRPLRSSFSQVKLIKVGRVYIINDALPGVEYVIELRTREEYDGLWSDWSEPVNASSWTAPSVSPLTTTVFPFYPEGSGADDELTNVDPEFSGPEPSHHILWILGSFVLLSVMLAIYIIRYKGRLVSKLQSLSVITKCGDPPQSQPSEQTDPEGQASVKLVPPCYKESPSSEAEREEEDVEEEEQGNDLMEALHFSNTSYFFLQKS
ncbi:interleukin-6 receptor subunit alpha [Cheilinus undulatus]|uniref:interleukin-6 receptor subunit alpha n=1 Tax=Cheilinus undulatus TaxID=241271 RepID=UPI001BD66014|nr:interleukin-6 receptor subunit alpha [Cheilinus undulatus]